MASHLLVLSLLLGTGTQALNNRPIIGILTMPNHVVGYEQYRSYFPASYVKWLEAAGARVVPLLHTATADETRAILGSINGVLFTGGGASFTNKNGSLTTFAKTAQVIFNESVTSWDNGEAFPLWGTCLGHELVGFLASNTNISTVSGPFDAENLTLPLTFTGAAASSRMYGELPPSVTTILSSQAVTMNNHQMGIAPADFAAAPSLASRFTVLSTNLDRVGVEFVSSTEGQNGLPIFTTQYHPEKVQFEWWTEEVVDHSFDSVMANHYLALQFVNETRANGAAIIIASVLDALAYANFTWYRVAGRTFPSPVEEAAALIYNYAAQYTASVTPGFQQTYFFD